MLATNKIFICILILTFIQVSLEFIKLALLEPNRKTDQVVPWRITFTREVCRNPMGFFHDVASALQWLCRAEPKKSRAQEKSPHDQGRTVSSWCGSPAGK